MATLAAFSLFTLAFVPVMAFGAIYAHIVREAGGAEYGLTTVVVTSFWLVNGVAAAVVGWLLGKYRLSTVAGFGAMMMVAGMMLASGFDVHWAFLLAGFGLLGGLGSAGIGSVTNFAAVSRFVRAPDRRMSALGIAATGMGFSSLVVFPLAIGLDRLGVQTSLYLLGILMSLVAVPAVASYRALERPSLGRSVDEGRSVREVERQWSRREASKTPQFWLLFVAAFSAPVAIQVMLVHQVRILEEGGLSFQTAAAAASMLGVASVVYRILATRLAGLVGIRGSYAIAVGFSIAGICSLFLTGSIGALGAFLYAGLFSAGYGAFAPMFPAASIELFGVDSFATIHGLLYGALALGAAIGPLAAGFLREASGDYSTSLLLVICAMAVSGIAYTITGASERFKTGGRQVKSNVTPV